MSRASRNNYNSLVSRPVARAAGTLAVVAVVGWPLRAQRPADPGPQSVPVGKVTITGEVADASTNEPLEGVVVDLRPDGVARGRTAISDAAGRFVIHNASPCRCWLTATLGGYLTMRFGQTRSQDSGTPIVVGKDAAEITLSLRMKRAGVIDGVVSGRNGRPVVGATVRAFQRTFVQNLGTVLTDAAEGKSDDRGQYRLWGLAPGDYVIDAATAVPPPDDVGLGWARTYYPGVLKLAQAALVTVSPGEERDAINVPIVDAPLVTVTGTLVSSTGGPLAEGRVQLVEPGDREFRFLSHLPDATMTRDGNFRLTGVIPGLYTLVASAQTPSGEFWGTLQLSVGSRGVDGQAVVLQPGARVAGRLVFHGAASPPLAENPRLWLMPIGRDSTFINGYVPSAKAEPDANGDLRFTFDSVPPGQYWVEPFDPSSPWAFRDTTAAGRDYTTASLEVRTDDVLDVVVTFSDRPPRLLGRVNPPSGRADDDCTVILFPADPAARVPWSPMIRTTRPGTDGTVALTGLVPGDYLIAAAIGVEANEWFDAKYLEALGPLSTAVSLREGASSSVSLRRVAPKGRRPLHTDLRAWPSMSHRYR